LSAQNAATTSTNEDGSLRRVLRPPLYSLTSTRFFAAFYVLVFHFASDRATSWSTCHCNSVSEQRLMGVPFFFILSAPFFRIPIWGNFGSEAREGGSGGTVCRVYPVYLLSLLIDWPIRGR